MAFLCAFPELLGFFAGLKSLVFGLLSLVVALITLVAMRQGRDGDDLPPASAAFLAAADPARPLDGSFASADAALAPTAPEPLSAPALKPQDSIPARESIGQLLFRWAEADARAHPRGARFAAPDRSREKS